MKGIKKLSNKQALLIDDKRLSHMSRGGKAKTGELTALKREEEPPRRKSLFGIIRRINPFAAKAEEPTASPPLRKSISQRLDKIATSLLKKTPN